MQGKFAILLLVAAAASAIPASKGTFEILPGLQNGYETQLFGYVIAKLPLRSYEEASSYCYNTLGLKFAALETKEEERYVASLIYGMDDVDQLWLGGKWNGNDSFIWEDGTPLRNDSVWLRGEPSERNDDSRVALMAVNVTRTGLTTYRKTERLSSLCEYDEFTYKLISA